MKAINDSTFEKEVIENEGVVVVDFWAPWCGPCRMVGPVMEELDNQYDGKITFTKVNVDECPLISQRYEIASIPTIMVFKNGKIAETMIGFRPKAAFEEVLNKHI